MLPQRERKPDYIRTPVPDELLPVYRTVRSWIEQAPWETGIADVWVLPDFNLLSYPVETFVDGSNLIVDEDLLRQFRVADRLSIAVKLTEPLPVNRPPNTPGSPTPATPRLSPLNSATMPPRASQRSVFQGDFA